jgi:hypothetical protein
LIGINDQALDKSQTNEQERQRLTPLFRLFHHTLNDHFYTTSPTERDSAVDSGYTYEKVECCVYLLPSDKLRPLRRLLSKSKLDHLYTTADPAIRQDEQVGYELEGIEGYVLAQPASDAHPLYHVKRIDGSDNFYTTSLEERDRALLSRDYESGGITGYVFLSSPSSVAESGQGVARKNEERTRNDLGAC